ncbi:MAG: type II toxin-antitoxin system RelE/ParE family toxin [Methylovirgula sp.]
MRRLRYTAAAKQDLNDILEFVTLQSRSADIARSFVGKVRAQCSKLASLPGIIGRPRPELRPDLRSSPFGGYVIFFRYLDDRLEIVDILESHRDIGAVMGEEER